MRLNPNKPAVLVSYAHVTEDMLQEMHSDGVNILLDSGAFTAWKKGEEVKIEEYIDFVHRHKGKFCGYFMLDKIGDPVATRENFKIMREAGLEPIPVFTRGAELEDLYEMVEELEVVGVGIGTKTKGSLNYLSYIASLAKENGFGGKLHWLGVYDLPMVKKFRPFSLDMSTFSNGLRFGKLFLPHPQERNGMIGLTKNNFLKKTQEKKTYFDRLFEAMKIDKSELLRVKSWRRKNNFSLIQKLSFLTFLILSRVVLKLYGVKMFAVIAVPGEYEIFRQSMQHFQELDIDEIEKVFCL